MFASTQDLEFVQGKFRDVPDRELGPNIGKITKKTLLYKQDLSLSCKRRGIIGWYLVTTLVGCVGVQRHVVPWICP